MCGLSASNTDANFASINYAVYFRYGVIRVYEQGVDKGSFGNFAVGDRLSVERVGTSISYKKNGTTFYTSGISSTGSLLVDTAIYLSGASIDNVNFVGVANESSKMISPVGGATVAGPVVTFQWSSGVGAIAYRLGVGSTLASLDTTGDIYDQPQGTGTSVSKQ